ncbi:MAG: amidohydrolase [Bacteroidales bacterium]|nr:amidohydrolase [Bacteroidales bacterium]
MHRLKERIETLAEENFSKAIEYYRHLHKHPELSFQEYKTSEYICQQLDQLHIPYKKGYVKTGIVATIQCNNPHKKVIALRADMDALPVKEDNNLPYISQNEGVMHACGHDIHMSCLLGVTRVLSTIKDELEGTILLIFQPAEEKLPGGAKAMTDDNALEPKPDYVIGQHVMTELPTGTIGLKSGKYMASTDELYLTISGKGGHAAIPEKFTDTILIASQIIVTLQQIVSRKSKATIPSVLSFGKVIANGATNIIPDKVIVEGTFRTMNEEWRNEALQLIENIAKSTAQMMGGGCEIKIVRGYPALIKDIDATQIVKQALNEYLGQSHVVDLEPQMIAEDFAYYAQAFPSVFYRLGISQSGIESAGLHSAYFKADEQALLSGIGAMAYITCKLLLIT